MSEVQEIGIFCPYCGEPQDVIVDGSDAGQQYVEDCQVCCRPMVMRVSVTTAGRLEIEARHEDEA